MNTPSNAMSQPPLQSQPIAPADISPAQRMYWSVRRELWETRSIYIAPLAVAALFLFGFLISLIHLPARMRAASALDPMQLHHLIEHPFDIAALLIMGTTTIVTIFYCLDALHGERRDRSILFWKSLPVSDLTTVLSKASIPLVILPLLTFAITFITQGIMLFLGTAVLLGSGLNVALLRAHFSFSQMSLMLLYHLIVIHGLWYAPIYGWLLLISAWARRLAILWATLPLFGIAVFERIAFNTSHFTNLLKYHFGSGPDGVQFPGDTMAMGSMAQLNPFHFLLSPGLWFGLAVTAIFLAAAVRLRRYREPL